MQIEMIISKNELEEKTAENDAKVMKSKELKKGYTTGSCVAAASGAALLTLFTGKIPETMQLTGPCGDKIKVPIENISIQNEKNAVCTVVKNSGDDPDVTDGIKVEVCATLIDRDNFEELINQSSVCLYKNGKLEIVKIDKEDRKAIYLLKNNIIISAEDGIGTVTKPGLACPPGFPAINPGPLEMIEKLCHKIAKKYAFCEYIVINVRIPEGILAAEKTFNPKLGIKGGISVLGTTGIVEPMSNEAMISTINVQISVAAAQNRRWVIITPGNYGKEFLKKSVEYENLKNIANAADDQVIKCSNYFREAIFEAGKRNFESVILSGHIGKMIKLAGGMLNTHSKYGDNRMNTISDIIREMAEELTDLPLDKILEQIKECVMTDEAVRILKEWEIDREFMRRVEIKIRQVVKKEKLLKKEQKLGVILFSNKYGLLYSDENACENIGENMSSKVEKKEKGKIYGIGVGPGDSELMTLKALRLLNECDCIALPDSGKGEGTAYEIVKKAVKEIDKKEKIHVKMPMTRDSEILREAREKAANAICEKLDEGKTVVFATLGDPTVYSTYTYLHKIVTGRGYEGEIIPGVTSFCAAAARLEIPLAEANQGIYIIPGSYGDVKKGLAVPGTKVIMKSGKSINNVVQTVREHKEDFSYVGMVERCSMDGEKLYRTEEEIGESSEYFSLMIIKDKE